MSQASRLLKIGAMVTTDYDKQRVGITRHMIVSVRQRPGTQSGIQFQVTPPPRLCNKFTWIDADWFEPVYNEKEQFTNDLVKAWESSGDAT